VGTKFIISKNHTLPVHHITCDFSYHSTPMARAISEQACSWGDQSIADGTQSIN